MSQEEKIDPWTKLDQKLQPINAQLKSLSEQFQKISYGKESTDENFEHWAKHVKDCPTCKDKTIKLAAELKPRGEYFCEDCGEDVKLEEEKCATCGGTNARKRKTQ